MKQEYKYLQDTFGTHAINFLFSFDRFREERKTNTLKEIIKEIKYLNSFF